MRCGYSQQSEAEYPKFYEVLKDIKVAIAPLAEKGMFPTKVQTFNNSVGYASSETGGNLIVKQQWIDKPAWEIYICDDGQPYMDNLINSLVLRKTKFIPYLGTNDHFATIEQVEKVEFSPVNEFVQVCSLCPKSKVEISEVDEWDTTTQYFKYEEKLPYKLDKLYNQYEFETFICTNQQLKGEVFKAKEKYIHFI